MLFKVSLNRTIERNNPQSVPSNLYSYLILGGVEGFKYLQASILNHEAPHDQPETLNPKHIKVFGGNSPTRALR